ncbi:O-antigen ligase family protein [Coleofasciculus sp. H7-2]|uniref:O-antigen ligase family protein n=1 Tax=Coleofasciculus sp. H7-2 TaxID=3351545 RepID=UPI003670C888
MKYLYTLLFSLSIILINPWGLSRGEIWTQPKVFVVLLITLLNLFFLWKDRFVTIPRSWFISRLLWELFLGIGLLSTIQSPFPLRSLFGQEQIGDGWLYWLIIAVFTLSNTLLLRLYPELLRSQLNGLLIGGVIVAISIFPQAIDWRIDYTATMGQLLQENVLVSTIFVQQQPIGLYSHRGHAAFVLAATGVLSLVGWRWNWLSLQVMQAVVIPIVAALLLTQTRMGIVAMLVGTAYLLGRKYYKLLVVAALVCLLVVGIATSTRRLNNLPLIKQITSDRVWLWELASRGIRERPLLGWGMHGFGTAYPYVMNPNWTPKVVRLGNFSFDYFSRDGQLQTRSLSTSKAHNLILDTTLSVGFLGMLSYLTLLGFCLCRVIQSPYRGIEAVALAYLIFTLTWFECAQFTHLPWWALSLTDITSQKRSPISL